MIRSIRAYHQCGHCHKKMEFVSTGRFRVNANGSLIDVWLIFQCAKCGHTLNLSIYRRKRAATLAAGEYEAFLDNDSTTVARYAADTAFLKRNGLELR